MSWSTELVDSGGVRVRVTRTGGDKPPIVLLHGYTDDGLCWTRVTRRLESAYDVVMLDARGHGGSDAPEGGYAYADQAGDVLAVIRALGLGKVILAGHSMGAAVATEVALSAKGAVIRLILEDPPRCAGPFPERTGRVAAEERARLLSLRAKTQAELVEECKKSHPGWQEDEVLPWAESKRRLRPEIVRSFVALAAPWWPRIGEVICPILLLSGEPSRGALISEEGSAVLRNLWQNGSVVRLLGAGHCVHRDRFEPYMQAFVQFIAGKPRRARRAV